MVFSQLVLLRYSRLTSPERISIFIPNDIKDVLVGILLGDALISRRSATANSRLVYGQTKA